MKRASVLFVVILSAGILSWSARQTPVSDQASLAPAMPAGALLYLEARDFSGLLVEWDQSFVKREWLKSENFEVFSRSRLFLRLREAQTQFAVTAGIPPDGKFLAQAAGKQSALALYDIGNLEFLYISRVASADAMQSALWQSRAKFEPRSAGGITFYVRRDSESHRIVAFALANDCLYLATREELLAQALESAAGGKNPKLTEENWFQSAVAATGRPGDLRMVLNFDKLVASSHFRSYWIERNVSEIRNYVAGVSDLYRENATYREERVLLRKEYAPTPANSSSDVPLTTPEGQRAAADLLASVPADAGLYRANANPTPPEVFSLVSNKLLAPGTTTGPPPKVAPTVQLTAGVVGNSSDLETHIDEAPAAASDSSAGATALRRLFEVTPVLASLQSESTGRDAETSFVQFRRAIVLSAAVSWDAEAVRSALQSAVAEITIANLGASWRRAGPNSGELFCLDGQFPLCVAVRGKHLLLSNRIGVLASLSLHSSNNSSPPPLRYAAGFNHAAEHANFLALSSALDCSDQSDNADTPRAQIAPAFFSGNLGSLSRVFVGLRSVSIVERESGNKLLETVTYHWAN